ncbi:gliding motility-associated C-terminal domain-containing protein [Arenibacter sp. BSSL-BM3]|uniref:Gliding motility-associated C-terminal domain-containing protein n=1 Tax=Arenibacter arenosicollis TaxID=2762274 RepID=A0ABR7QI62_9FLAO|nr:gliding motility-associated C-terminal domain-containing protein [Arenibacter arenosicollis]MBC8766881.1 gliding motility-associated C-terminal domain-containing protein [Arenibacter arenosicollis]
MNPNKKNNLLIFVLTFMMLGINFISAQTLNKPTPADNPNIAGNSPWTAVCASADFNEYYVKFSWSPPLVNSDNTFILELSDANGSFASPTQLVSDNTKNTTFNFDFKFELPTIARGDGYKMRVRSTSPAKTSPVSDAFEMYYIDFKSSLLISPNGNGNIPPGGTIELCDGNSATLAVHNVPNPETYQYNWYRSGSPLAEKSHSITISQAGIYMVEVDYGTVCSGSANTLSNYIEITTGASLGIALNAPSKTALCSGETEVLEANIMGQGLSYTWFKNGTAITAPIVDAYTYTVDAAIVGFEGDYAVEIDGDGTCLERSASITMTNAGDFTVTRDNEPNIVILPNQTKTLTVSTSAPSPAYQWYKDNTAIVGETNSTLTANTIGVYYAEVTLSGGACTSATKNTETTTLVNPDSFEIITDYTTEYTDCVNTSVALEVSKINAVLSDGSKTDVTADLKSNFSYQWTKDGANVPSANGSSISLTNTNENGEYKVLATLDSFNSSSNALTVRLLTNETLTVSASGSVICNSNESIDIFTTTVLTGESYDWFRDGVNLNTASESLSATTPGTYQLIIQKNGCDLKSNEIIISPLDASLIALSTTNNEVVFPEGGSKIISASGAISYKWYDQNNVLISDTDTVSITQEGSYLVTATINNCEVSKSFTASFQDTFGIPNVITANGDGFNDQWVIPNTYTKDPNISVIIYNDKGEEVISQKQYQNNWPEATMKFPKQNMVFYYTIKNAKETLKKGTITVIR